MVHGRGQRDGWRVALSLRVHLREGVTSGVFGEGEVTQEDTSTPRWPPWTMLAMRRGGLREGFSWREGKQKGVRWWVRDTHRPSQTATRVATFQIPPDLGIPAAFRPRPTHFAPSNAEDDRRVNPALRVFGGAASGSFRKVLQWSDSDPFSPKNRQNAPAPSRASRLAVLPTPELLVARRRPRASGRAGPPSDFFGGA